MGIARYGRTSGPRETGALIFGVPSMNIDLEVKVLWEVGRNDPSEPQGDDREGIAESSGEQDLCGDVQESDARRGESGRAGM